LKEESGLSLEIINHQLSIINLFRHAGGRDGEGEES